MIVLQTIALWIIILPMTAIYVVDVLLKSQGIILQWFEAIDQLIGKRGVYQS